MLKPNATTNITLQQLLDIVCSNQLTETLSDTVICLVAFCGNFVNWKDINRMYYFVKGNEK